MADEPRACPRCGEPVPPEVLVCPSCGTNLQESAPPRPASPPPAPKAKGAGPFSADLTRRLARLALWHEAALALNLELPTLPKWAESAARNATNPEEWADVLRGVERIAQQKVAKALEEWDRATKSRLSRLEAYSVDSRLERDQIEDLIHAARAGDLSQALATFQQVDKVVTLKERHLDQAREELERVVSMLRDMQALGLDPPQEPDEIAEDLERELRGGRLASLKQQIRALRAQCINRLKTALPAYVTEYGDDLVLQRANGVAVELEAMELARGAREFARGRPEEALRRLRALAQTRGVGPVVPASGRTPAARAPVRKP